MLVLVCKINVFIRGDQMWEVLTSCVSWRESKLRSCDFTWTPWTPSLSWENMEAMTVLLFLQPRLFSNTNHQLLLHWYRGWRCAQKNIVPVYAFVRSVVVSNVAKSISKCLQSWMTLAWLMTTLPSLLYLCVKTSALSLLCENHRCHHEAITENNFFATPCNGAN